MKIRIGTKVKMVNCLEIFEDCISIELRSENGLLKINKAEN
jgi:hypothetical protein